MPAWLSKINLWPIAMVLILLPAAFMAGGAWDGDGREDRAFRKANQVNQLMQLACMTDKATAWEEVRNARTEKFAQSVQFDRILGAGDAERAAFRAELNASAAATKRARDEAAETMRRLDDARSELARTWREGRVPTDITCGVLLTPGCPGIPGSAAGAADRGDQPVSPRSAGEHAGAGGAGAGAAVPATSGDRPRDADGGK